MGIQEDIDRMRDMGNVVEPHGGRDINHVTLLLKGIGEDITDGTGLAGEARTTGTTVGTGLTTQDVA